MATKRNYRKKLKKFACQEPQGLEHRYFAEGLNQDCSKYNPWVKIGPVWGSCVFLTCIYSKTVKIFFRNFSAKA
jgi:hypothetical protein